MVHILNRQKFRRLNITRLKKLAGFFLNKSAAAVKKSFEELSLLLTDDAGIRQINRQFFDRDCATDVISFALRPHYKNEAPCARRNSAGSPLRPRLCRGESALAKESGHLAGEIALNVERAVHEGRRRRGFEHEFALYLAHGCDHLAGHGDRTVKERRKMRRRELGWLKEASRHNLL